MRKPILLFAALLVSCASQAGPGHDHGAEAPGATASDAPRRQPDGSVFLPKPAQRQLEVRTIVVKADELPRTIELTGRVVADPNAGGRVQPTTAGRI
jgi:membrane fusion protein, heavy metal efflux system